MGVEFSFNSHIEECLQYATSANARALMRIGALVQGAAAVNSPVRTGALRSSWTVDVATEGSGGVVVIGVPLDALEGNYAKYVEAGTTRMAPRHMLRNAVNETMPYFGEIVNEEYINA